MPASCISTAGSRRKRRSRVEFVSTSITSGGDGQDQSDSAKALVANNPQLKFINQQRGYVVCDVTPERWQSEFKVLDRISTPGGTLSTRTKLAVAAKSNTLVTAYAIAGNCSARAWAGG